MIPPFDPATGALPPGIHEATWAEVMIRYGYNPVRCHLLAGLRMALQGPEPRRVQACLPRRKLRHRQAGTGRL